ncbi:MAG: hypothetical protein ABIL37_05300 [candidate division WOR-3 bacterium]
MIYLVFNLIIEVKYATSQDSKNYFLIQKNDSITNFFINNFTKTYKKPSIPTLLEIRDCLNVINSSLEKYSRIQDSLKINDILQMIGKFKLYDLQVIYILAYLSYNFELNFNVYCAVKYSESFKHFSLFDMGLIYGFSSYMCYPLLVIDNYYIIGPRKMYVLSRVSDFERFPDELFSVEVPQLKNQMKGYKIKLLESSFRTK